MVLDLVFILLFQGSNSKGLLGKRLPADFKVFSPDSPWNTPIHKNPELDRFSTQMIRRLQREGKKLKADAYSWTIPLYVIDAATAPKRQFIHKEGYHDSIDPLGEGLANGIPFPAGVLPDPKRDAHLLLVDPKLRKTWDFSRLVNTPDSGWTATRIDVWDLDGPGYREPFDGQRWWMAGARASGMPLIAGLIRPEEIEAGAIHHALAFACPNIRQSPYDPNQVQLCPPASRSDGQQLGFTFLPMGARLQLDPDLDLESLNLSEPVRIIAKAMQVYGMYLCDGAETFKLYFQNMGKGDNTWSHIGTFKDLGKIPISSFRVLECEYATGKR